MRTQRRHHPALSAPARLERISIIIIIVASLTLGLLGLVISLASASGAVFLDGVFSLIFAMADLLTLYVSGLVQRPHDDQYPFGYATFEPMLNLFKGILIAFALIFAAWSAASAWPPAARTSLPALPSSTPPSPSPPAASWHSHCASWPTALTPPSSK